MRTRRFTISRTVVARIAVEEYLYAFWWVVLPVPLFGLLALLFSPPGAVQVIGLFALLWPLSLMARAWFATGKAGRLYESGLEVTSDDEALYFTPDTGSGIRLRHESVRSVAERHGYRIYRLRRTGFMLVPVEAIEDAGSWVSGLGSRER